MKRILKQILLLTLYSGISIAASAHAVFIETALKGNKGKAHTIKVVYGEPDEHEEISKWWWYKEGTVVKLTLTKADGSKEILKLTPQNNALVATFTPDQDGVYHVAIQHETERKTGAKSQYQINAHASIQVGNSKKGNLATNVGNALVVYPAQDLLNNKKEVALTLYENGKPAVKAFFQIISPNGWIKWIETDQNGVARFIPEWKGKYFAEGSKKEKVADQAFEEYNRATSMSFEVI
ncbi:MAG: hypothetical protein WC623_19735 [Pedobacter sp.]|uniref:hypothetical protein n=1 Tax=Pedobacter sp. TaxID=1411316 RepID=UPI00356400F6